jgi:tetratricopeptide (TPR) repeat protein
MQIHHTDETVVRHRDLTRDAVALASQGRWEEAAEVNRDILRSRSDDVEAFNRLGKALSQMGRYSDARGAFQESLDRDPANPIARKNLERLASLRDAPNTGFTKGATPRLFIEESGKSCVTTLWFPGPETLLARVAAGDPVTLRVEGATVVATTAVGEPLGWLEPKLAARLARLIPEGNRYASAVASVGNGAVAVALREVFRHPRVSGVLSFPSRANAQDGYPPASSTSDAPGQARRGSQPAFDSGEGATDRAGTEG